jgi:cyclase
MDRTLIVARLRPGTEQDIADIFATSDSTRLPRLIGVRTRTLFSFHNLYMHLIEAERPVFDSVDEVRHGQLFREVSDSLAAFIEPYDQQTWRSPADAMATVFYHWQNPDEETGER